jgi:synaptobrevin family protein YKT6
MDPQGQRQSVQENNSVAHVYNRGGAEQLCGILYLICNCE